MKTKQTTAQKERAEQIRNVEAAYKRKEITAEFLEWYRRFTAKAITTVTKKHTAPRALKGETK